MKILRLHTKYEIRCDLRSWKILAMSHTYRNETTIILNLNLQAIQYLVILYMVMNLTTVANFWPNQSRTGWTDANTLGEPITHLPVQGSIQCHLCVVYTLLKQLPWVGF